LNATIEKVNLAKAKVIKAAADKKKKEKRNKKKKEQVEVLQEDEVRHKI
jgi:hypothetical protein